VCPSFDTYAGLCVSKYELMRNVGNSRPTSSSPRRISTAFVTSPFDEYTTTCGGLAPFPKTRSAVWFVS
jgi:hypothetical protein